MDKIIQALSEILLVTNKEISDLLQFSRYKVDESNSFGSKSYSKISTFEVISSPRKTSMLNKLNDDQKKVILDAVLQIFPIKNDSIEIKEIRFIADPLLSDKIEFIQNIDDLRLINDISIAINMLERKPPKFWIDYKSNIQSNLLEDDFRSEFFRMLGMKYQISSEEESKCGRTDLILKSTSLNRKIVEFKIWGRNQYSNTSQQLLRYLTEIDDSGFIIMSNNNKNKNIPESDYIKVIKCQEYIENSMQIKHTTHGLRYYEAEYVFNDNRKKVYHFVLNLK